MVRSWLLASLATAAVGSQCGTWCEDNSYAADVCDCGVCGSFGLCTFSCSEGAGRVACPTDPPAPTPTPPAPTPPAPSPAPTPPIPGIVHKQVKVGGFICDTIETASVYYPEDSSKKYPLLAFAHGWTEGGFNVAINYKDVLESVAAAGYVVIAQESCLDLLAYDAHKHDQLRALEYMKETQEFADRIDWDSQVGVYGHSMGGAASGMNGADAAAVSKYNIGAALCLHPAQGGQLSASLVPTFFATGSIDTIVPPEGVRLMYGLAKGPKIFAEMAGADHFECQSREDVIPEPAGWTHYVVHWMNCQLKGIQSDCDAAWSICDGHPETKKRMASCVVDKKESLAV